MLILFLVELFAFLSTTTETSVVPTPARTPTQWFPPTRDEMDGFLTSQRPTQVILDTNSDTQLRINFNITLMDLACDYAAVDVYDVLGTNTQVAHPTTA